MSQAKKALVDIDPNQQFLVCILKQQYEQAFLHQGHQTTYDIGYLNWLLTQGYHEQATAIVSKWTAEKISSKLTLVVQQNNYPVVTLIIDSFKHELSHEPKFRKCLDASLTQLPALPLANHDTVLIAKALIKVGANPNKLNKITKTGQKNHPCFELAQANKQFNTFCKTSQNTPELHKLLADYPELITCVACRTLRESAKEMVRSLQVLLDHNPYVLQVITQTLLSESDTLGLNEHDIDWFFKAILSLKAGPSAAHWYTALCVSIGEKLLFTTDIHGHNTHKQVEESLLLALLFLNRLPSDHKLIIGCYEALYQLNGIPVKGTLVMQNVTQIADLDKKLAQRLLTQAKKIEQQIFKEMLPKKTLLNKSSCLLFSPKSSRQSNGSNDDNTTGLML